MIRGLLPGAVLVASIATGAAAPEPESLRILYIGRAYDKPIPLSLMQTVPDDLGVAGARLALAEINTTGKFLNRHFDMDVVQLPHDRAGGRLRDARSLALCGGDCRPRCRGRAVAGGRKSRVARGPARRSHGR